MNSIKSAMSKDNIMVAYTGITTNIEILASSTQYLYSLQVNE